MASQERRVGEVNRKRRFSKQLVASVKSQVPCTHPTVIKDMCAECGADLRQHLGTEKLSTASIAMVHSVPELVVSEEEAQCLGKEDEARLLRTRKLALVVDLDQTVIHTTNDNVAPNIKDVYHFTLWSQNLWYHTRIRPNAITFLRNVSELYELHICTFGARLYAHTVARILDPENRLFHHRILSRDECFDPFSKTASIKGLFPCGDCMVCIIDDREDVWGYTPNLIHVKPYHFFKGTADINWIPESVDKGNDNEEIEEQFDDVDVLAEQVESAVENGANIKDVSICSMETAMVVTKHFASSENKTTKEAFVETKSNTSESQSSIIPSTEPVASSDGGIVKGKPLSDTITTDTYSAVVEGSDIMISSGPIDGVLIDSDNDTNSIKPVAEKVADVLHLEKSKCENDSKTETSQSELITDKTKTVGNNDTLLQKDKCESLDLVSFSEMKTENQIANDCLAAEKEQLQEKCEGDNLADSTAAVTVSDSEKCTSDVKKLESSDKQKGDPCLVDPIDEDDYLFYLEDILKILHKAFYDMYDQMQKEKKQGVPDMKNIVPYVRRKVLRGCNIVFSGVIPVNATPEKNRAYVVAKNLGANVQSDVVLENTTNKGKSEKTTHVIAAQWGTQKVSQAQKCKNIHIVTLDWLWSCNERWERVEETLFSLPPGKKKQGRDSPLLRCKLKAKKSKKPCDKVSSGPSQENPHFEYNALLSFSSAEIASMDREVSDATDEDSDEDEYLEDLEGNDDNANVIGPPSSSSSAESLSAEFPRGWSNKRKRSNSDDGSGDYGDVLDLQEGESDVENVESSLRVSDSDDPDESLGSVDEEMAAAVEKEFLGY